MATITYYDFSYINDAGFHALGFQRTQAEFGHQFVVSKNPPPELDDLDLPSWIPLKKPSSIMIYRYEGNGQNFFFCIDSGDYNGALPGFPGYYVELLPRVKYYFKVNYLREVIDQDPELAAHASKIIPIPITFGLRPDNLRPFRPKVLPGGVHWPLEAVRRRLRLMKNLPRLEDFEEMREIPRDIDVFFVSILYQNPEHQEMNAWRLAVVEALSKQKDLNMVIGFVSQDEGLPDPYASYRVPRMDLPTYMNMLARSKIGLYVRGTFDAISYKFGQLYALGKPIVGQSIINNRGNLYQLDNFSEQFIYDDSHELAERIITLVKDQEELDYLTKVNTRTFENHLSPMAISRLMFSHLDKVP